MAHAHTNHIRLWTLERCRIASSALTPHQEPKASKNQDQHAHATPTRAGRRKLPGSFRVFVSPFVAKKERKHFGLVSPRNVSPIHLTSVCSHRFALPYFLYTDRYVQIHHQFRGQSCCILFDASPRNSVFPVSRSSVPIPRTYDVRTHPLRCMYVARVDGSGSGVATNLAEASGAAVTPSASSQVSLSYPIPAPAATGQADTRGPQRPSAGLSRALPCPAPPHNRGGGGANGPAARHATLPAPFLTPGAYLHYMVYMCPPPMVC